MTCANLFDTFPADLLQLIEQYRDDLAEDGWSGYVRCAACGDRVQPVDHVRDRLAELEGVAYIPVSVDDASSQAVPA